LKRLFTLHPRHQYLHVITIDFSFQW